jgi:hypothetical protein
VSACWLLGRAALMVGRPDLNRQPPCSCYPVGKQDFSESNEADQQGALSIGSYARGDYRTCVFSFWQAAVSGSYYASRALVPKRLCQEL